MSTHMTLEDRTVIEVRLNAAVSLGQIAKELGKANSTVSREIRGHRIVSEKSASGRVPNCCIHRRDCDVYSLCETCRYDNGRICRACNLCNTLCPDFKEDHCDKLNAPPYVCNGCPEKVRCTLRKFVYDARYAQNEYRTVLTEAREGFNLTKQEVQKIDKIVSPLLKNGQSIHHIWVHHASELSVSERSIARLLEGGMLTAGVLDQRRKCGLKPRKTKPKEMKIDSKCRIGRTYEDYQRFLLENDVSSIVQMDTVYGSMGGKVLFTLIFLQTELMLAFLCDDRTASSILKKLRFLWSNLGEEIFSQRFQVLLTDNGSEFSDPTAIERRPDGSLRTHVFYCDPGASYQKGVVERNHEFIRFFLPKSSSFDNLTQTQVNLMMSHINSYSRPGLNDKTPYEMFAFLYGQDALNQLLHLLCLTVIPPDNIVLKSSILEPQSST